MNNMKSYKSSNTSYLINTKPKLWRENSETSFKARKGFPEACLSGNFQYINLNKSHIFWCNREHNDQSHKENRQIK